MKYRNAILAAEIINRVMIEGAKSHPGQDYRTISFQENIQHAYRHLVLLARGDTTEDHLDNALTRLSMAAEVKERGAAVAPLGGSVALDC